MFAFFQQNRSLEVDNYILKYLILQLPLSET